MEIDGFCNALGLFVDLPAHRVRKMIRGSVELVLDGFMIDWGEGKSFAAHRANCAWNEGDPVVRKRQVARRPRCFRETLSRFSTDPKLTEAIRASPCDSIHACFRSQLAGMVGFTICVLTLAQQSVNHHNISTIQPDLQTPPTLRARMNTSCLKTRRFGWVQPLFALL